MRERKTKLSLWVVLPAFLMILGGVVAEVQSVIRFNLLGLVVGWFIAMGGVGLIAIFAHGIQDISERIRAKLSYLLTTAVDVFLYGMGLGLLLILMGGALSSFERHGLMGNWWTWGVGAVLAFFILWAVLKRWKKKKQKRLARIFANIVAMGLLFFNLVLVLGSFDIKSSESEEPADGRPPLPRSTDNAYTVYVAATNAVINLSRKPLEDVTEEESARIVGSNAVALALLHKAANCQTWDDGEMDSPAEYNVFPMKDFIQLARLERIKIRTDINRGRLHDALTTARDMALHSRLVLEHAQTVLAWYYAVVNRNSADAALMDILASGKAADDDLAEMREILSLTETDRAWDLERLCRAEHLCFSSYISWIAKSQYIHGRIKTDSIVGRYLFHPERTRSASACLVAHYRPFLRKPGFELAEWMEVEKTAHLIAETTIGNGLFPGQNWVGSIMLRILGVDWRNIVHMKVLSEFSHDAVRLALAVEAHRRRTGKVPSSLDELVPAFINTVPLDPFNLPSQLNYDPEQGIIWTVGKNKTCNGVKTKSKTASYGIGNSKYVRNINGTPIP